MKLYLLLLILPFTIQSQTGPGGVGLNDGTSSLKIWYRTDNGVITGGTQINQIVNSAGIPALDISETEVMIEMEELPRGLYLLKTTHSSGMVYKE